MKERSTHTDKITNVVNGFPPIGKTLQLLHAKDEGMWGEFYTKLTPFIERKASGLVGREAEQVSQEVWLGFFTNVTKENFDPDRFESFTDVVNYLLVSATNRARDVIKREKTQRTEASFEQIEEVEADKLLTDGSPGRKSVEDIVLGSLANEKLRNRLPGIVGEVQADALFLIADGHDSISASEVLGVPPGTIKSRLNTARKRVNNKDALSQISLIMGRPIEQLEREHKRGK